MNRLAQTIERLQEPLMQASLAAAQERQREAWREHTRDYYERNHPTRPTTHRSYVHRWQEIQARQRFLASGLPCQHCGSSDRLEVSHKVALHDGGTFDQDNLQWLCHACHVAYDER